MTTKPSRMWHADGEGRCHAGCEAFSQQDDDKSYNACNALAVLPWPMRARQTAGQPCPFAVLADVLALHTREPDEDRWCGTCANQEPTGCPYVHSFAADPAVVSRYVGAADGPPWPSCRFWRKR